MEVREVFKLEQDGRTLKVHVTEHELQEIVQVGLMTLLQQGYINFKNIPEDQEILIDETATKQ